MGADAMSVDLSEQDREVQATVHSFAEEVIRPAAKVLDRLPDPAGVIAPDSILWEVVEHYRKLGLDQISSPDNGLSPAEQARCMCIVSEETAWGDVGLAITCGMTNFHQPWIQMTGDKELWGGYGAPGTNGIGCWAVTEPDHGSDSITFTERHFSDHSLGANCVATRDGDDYVIRGQKAAWVSCGSVATVAVLFCSVETEHGIAGRGGFVVPLDLPGIHRPQPLDKLGQRTLNQGEIFFEEVRVPSRWMVLGPEVFQLGLETMLCHGNAGLAQLFVGVARASYEHALTYAHERVQGGMPIAEHQSVKARLFEMFMKVEAARALAQKVAVYNAVNPPSFQHSAAAKVFTTNTAFEVASAACQIFGGNGMSREYPVEKLLRDARASLIEDGCNEVLGLMAASRLSPDEN